MPAMPADGGLEYEGKAQCNEHAHQCSRNGNLFNSKVKSPCFGINHGNFFEIISYE